MHYVLHICYSMAVCINRSRGPRYSFTKKITSTILDTSEKLLIVSSQGSGSRQLHELNVVGVQHMLNEEDTRINKKPLPARSLFL
jgi:hypothetical protein